MKKVSKGLLASVLVSSLFVSFSAVSTFAATQTPEKPVCLGYINGDKNGICDNRSICTNFIEKNSICDSHFDGTDFIDEDNDGVCDNCADKINFTHEINDDSICDYSNNDHHESSYYKGNHHRSNHHRSNHHRSNHHGSSKGFHCQSR